MHNAEINARISVRIREARDYLELSVEELAEAIGVTAEKLLSIENGEDVADAALLPALAKSLGRGLDYFTGGVAAQDVVGRVEFLARAAETLSDQDMDELERFAHYLRSRSQDVAA